MAEGNKPLDLKQIQQHAKTLGVRIAALLAAQAKADSIDKELAKQAEEMQKATARGDHDTVDKQLAKFQALIVQRQQMLENLSRIMITMHEQSMNMMRNLRT